MFLCDGNTPHTPYSQKSIKPSQHSLRKHKNSDYESVGREVDTPLSSLPPNTEINCECCLYEIKKKCEDPFGYCIHCGKNLRILNKKRWKK
jgi:hypothetical protein